MHPEGHDDRCDLRREVVGEAFFEHGDEWLVALQLPFCPATGGLHVSEVRTKLVADCFALAPLFRTVRVVSPDQDIAKSLRLLLCLTWLMDAQICTSASRPYRNYFALVNVHNVHRYGQNCAWLACLLAC